MFHCDWSVAGRLMRQMSLTRTHHATVVGPIRFSNRSNNCRVCKINGRQLSLVRTHHATIVFSSSLRPTDDKNRMVCAGLYSEKEIMMVRTCRKIKRHLCKRACNAHYQGKVNIKGEGKRKDGKITSESGPAYNIYFNSSERDGRRLSTIQFLSAVVPLRPFLGDDTC